MNKLLTTADCWGATCCVVLYASIRILCKYSEREKSKLDNLFAVLWFDYIQTNSVRAYECLIECINEWQNDWLLFGCQPMLAI